MNEIDPRIDFQVGCILRHFKYHLLSDAEKAQNKHLYRCIAFAKHTETCEDLIIYQALYGDFKTFARPVSMCKDILSEEQKAACHQSHRLEVVSYNANTFKWEACDELVG